MAAEQQATAYCPHFDDVIPVGTCSICKHGPTVQKPLAPPVADSGPFPATLEGECPSCGYAISQGDRLVHATDGKYHHASCLGR